MSIPTLIKKILKLHFSETATSCLSWNETIRFGKEKFSFTIWFALDRQWNQSFWYWNLIFYYDSLPRRLVSLPIWNESYRKWKIFVPKNGSFRFRFFQIFFFSVRLRLKSSICNSEEICNWVLNLSQKCQELH